MAYCAPMPIEDERAAWLTGLRTEDRDLHARLDTEVAGRRIATLEERLLSLQAEVSGLRGAVRVRDRLLQDHLSAVAERDALIETLSARVRAEENRGGGAAAVSLARKVVRLPRRVARRAVRVLGR
ncbi:hypothetical protein Celf_2510 [Cellulomonas fimi ATCC 484]|uniref:Uncharacterized protein n=2 Tax=Cellulomonas fimi TaxID=1708 RepID=F4H529_CELFA|nr:hypothetical protein Celf_2510 [Cellulomonas fimi ATCC 484]VEH33729.1 Uncharacterised protein [Cellulomonas fimi]